MSNSRLRLAAILLIALGIAETVAFVLALIYEFSFGGGSLVYVYAGYRLLKRSPETYKAVTSVLTVFLALLLSGYCVLALVFVYALETNGLSIRLSLPAIPTLVVAIYSVLIVYISYLLFHPETRRELNLKPAGSSAWILYLGPRRTVGVVASAAVLAGLFLGPHMISNPLQLVASAIRNDSQLQSVVGDVDRIALLSYRALNWTLFTSVKVTGSENIGYYFADVAPDGSVNLNSYDFARMPKRLVPSTSDTPEVPEYEIQDETSEGDVVLLSTSFERQGARVVNDIAPFVQHGKLPWTRQSFPRSGQFAVNAIPDGNPGRLSYFGESLSNALLSSTLDGTYEPFDVSPYRSVTLEFWRFSSSNPSETHNCLGSIRVDFRLDDQEWQSKMAYCGRYKSRATKWSHGSLTFDTTGSRKLDILFEYEFPPSSRIDRSAMYLIDDLLVRASR